MSGLVGLVRGGRTDGEVSVRIAGRTRRRDLQEWRGRCGPSLVLAVGVLLSLAAPSEATIRTGSYTGNGTSQSITGLGYQPDFVLIRGNATQMGVTRTSTMTTA